ncbi:MAG: A24 family peptidase [Sedimentisphaerales bacterium]|jgi:prepilin peptidase CpaA
MELTLKDIIQWGVVIGASLVAAIMDIRTRRIPNLLCGPLFVAGLVWSAWHGGAYGFVEALGAAVLLALPFVLLFMLAGGGAGDAKLTAAIGAWLSIREAGIALACICIAGGILGIIVAIYKRRLKIVCANLVLPVCDLLAAMLGLAVMKQAIESTRAIEGEKLTVPYGVAIFVGVCVAGGIVLI